MSEQKEDITGINSSDKIQEVSNNINPNDMCPDGKSSCVKLIDGYGYCEQLCLRALINLTSKNTEVLTSDSSNNK